MKVIEQALRPTRIAILVAAAGMLPLAGQAQGTSMSEMQSRYQADIQRCATLTDPESQRTCRREAGAGSRAGLWRPTGRSRRLRPARSGIGRLRHHARPLG